MLGPLARAATSTTGVIALPLCAAVFTALVQKRDDGAWVAYLVLRVVLVAGFTLTSLLLAREPLQRANATIFAGTTVALILGWIHVWTPTPIPLIASVASSMMWGGLAWVVLRYPHDQLDDRASRAFVVFGLTWLGIGHTVVAATYDSLQAPLHGWPTHTWRPTIPALYGENHLIVAVSGGVDVVFVLVFLALLGRRIRRTGGLDRAMSAPMFAGGIAAAVPLFNRLPSQVLGTTQAEFVQAVMQKCFLLVVPVAFIVVLVRERLACAAVIRAVHAGGRSLDDVEQSLRSALHDPALELVPIDAYASIGADPSTGAKRVRVDVVNEGASVGVLGVDRALTLHPTLLQTVLDCCERAMELERLHGSVRAHLSDVTVARRDAADSARLERSRLERDLHDGVQQRLLALNLRLAKLQLDRAPTDQILNTVREQIKLTNAELRELTHGRGIGAVHRDGVAGAVENLCRALPIATTTDVEDRRWPEPVEQTAYFVVCEGLANVMKHANAESASVSIRQRAGTVHVQVTDTGSGLADEWSGSGLNGLRQRVERLDGVFHVESSPSIGTRLIARIPAEPVGQI